MKTTSIITVNYNQPVHTKALLNSIEKHCPKDTVEIILVDNAPRQDHEQEFKTCYPGLTYIKSDRNLGFAGANNLGFLKAKGDFILLLNNDTEITDGAVETLINEMNANPEIGLLSPLIKFFENKNIIQYAGFTPMNYFTARNKTIGYLEEDKGQYNNISCETGFCHGAAVMCRRKDLNKAGFMEEGYFLYYEELDWCEKFRRIEKKIWFTGKAVVYHKESMSVGKESPLKTYFITRNRMLFTRRNADPLSRFFFGLYFPLIAVPKTVIGYLIRKRFELARQTIRGLWWNFTNSVNSKNIGFEV